MRFEYYYRTKDNESCRGVITARDREAAFLALRLKGIKPSRVVDVSGVVESIIGRGKRWIAIGVLCVVSLFLLCVAISFRERLNGAVEDWRQSPRHQIYGDPARMENLERNDFSDVFELRGERILARYAQPGNLISSGAACNVVRNINQRTADAARIQMDCESLVACLTNEIVLVKSDSREVIELKQIVNWMKDELRRYLANGVGTPSRYFHRLNDRQFQEAQLYATAKRDLEDVTDPLKFERTNASLRAVGLKTIPLPVPAPSDED